MSIELPVLPDAELLVVKYQRSLDQIRTFVSSRVWTERPSNFNAKQDLPFLEIKRLGGTVRVPRHLDGARMQLDAWGRTKAEAHNLAQTARAAMWVAHLYQHEIGVLTGVEEEIGPTWLPDAIETGGPRTPRYTQSLIVFLHPHRTSQ